MNRTIILLAAILLSGCAAPVQQASVVPHCAHITNDGEWARCELLRTALTKDVGE